MMRVWWLGRRAYAPTYALQHALVEQVAGGRAPETLILVEHDPVLTCGRGTDRANLGRGLPRLPMVEVERGGDVTWHGPGQLVGYPILRLEGAERDLHLHLRRLEELLIRTCEDLGCSAGRNPGYTGVWTPRGNPARKTASIGIAVRRWVTYHGFALNVNVPPESFETINPCGLDAGVMTSLHLERGAPIGLERVIESLLLHLPATLQRRPVMARAPVLHRRAPEHAERRFRFCCPA